MEQTPAQIAAQKVKEAADAQTAANLEAQKVYQAAVGKKFTDGKSVGHIKEYLASHEFPKHGRRQGFLVNFGNPHCSFFHPCKEFMEKFNTEETEKPAQSEVLNNLPQ